MEKYFAYGSNMNLARMIKRLKREIPCDQRRRATLRGYRLEFNKSAKGKPRKGYANIVPDERKVVEGAIYDDMSNSDMEKLDICEGYRNGHYDKVRVRVEDDHGQITDAIAYIAQPDKIAMGLKPSKDYLSHLLEAKDLLSKDYYSKLEDTETLDYC